MVRTYRPSNLIVEFSKYEFYNKLLGGVTLLRLTPDVLLSNVTPLNNWIQIFKNLPLNYIIFVYSPLPVD